MLQGWATLENFSGQDWSGVDLTLVSGRPVAYRQALYRAYMIDRPRRRSTSARGSTPASTAAASRRASAAAPTRPAAR